ncbi:MAG TPA: hypothetical protein VN726_15230 [Hanamia sp.]|nr:hypothetical protein [Hanamia sp.]
MADVHTKEIRSYDMSQIKGKNTKPEMLVRKFLHVTVAVGTQGQTADNSEPTNDAIFIFLPLSVVSKLSRTVP